LSSIVLKNEESHVINQGREVADDCDLMRSVKDVLSLSLSKDT
jgi:hypothetical protein